MSGPNPVRTSKIHYIILAGRANLYLCYNLLSSAASRYPVPLLLRYNDTGKFDAAQSQLAKLRAIQRYLTSLDTQD